MVMTCNLKEICNLKCINVNQILIVVRDSEGLMDVCKRNDPVDFI